MPAQREFAPYPRSKELSIHPENKKVLTDTPGLHAPIRSKRPLQVVYDLPEGKVVTLHLPKSWIRLHKDHIALSAKEAAKPEFKDTAKFAKVIILGRILKPAQTQDGKHEIDSLSADTRARLEAKLTEIYGIHPKRFDVGFPTATWFDAIAAAKKMPLEKNQKT